MSSLAFASLRVFVCNYVFYSFGLILRYIFRFFHLGDAKGELIVPPRPQADGTERNLLSDSQIDGFREELVNFLFWNEDFHGGSEEREGETECSAFMEAVPEESEKIDGETECSALMENRSDIHEDSIETKEIESDIHEDGMDGGTEEDRSVFMVIDSGNSVNHEDGKENGGVTEGSVSMETNSVVHQDETKSSVSMENDSEKIGGAVIVETVFDAQEGGMKIDENETESSVFMLNVSGVNEDSEKMDEDETECSVFKDDGSKVSHESKREENEEETEGPVFVETDSLTTTSQYQYMSGQDISGFIEEPTTLRFSFREFYMGPDVSAVSDNACAKTGIIADKEFSELDSEEDPVEQEEKEELVLVQEQVSIPSTNVSFHFGNDAFGGTDSSDEDYFLFNENSLTSDSESESSSSSGLIWGNSDKTDDPIAYQFLGGKNGGETEILKLIMREERTEAVEEKQSSYDRRTSEFGVHDSAKAVVKDKKEGSHHEEKACRNGLEKTEETKWEEILESPKVVEDLKPLKIEEKLDYKDQIDEIEKVYKSYAEKMRKLDILNYQTMHALGLLQLKDPLKLISIPKSTIPGAKPVISQNLWPRKASKNTSDPLLKLVHELHRDLELVYVGQVCLSWEILCWQHKKAIELQQYDSQGSHRYNIVAGEFQLFQVLLQRFIENEPFQGGPRIQNYVKNRCVIRNLLQVPGIKDDDDDSKGGEEDAIASGRLADIIKESMRVFWEFVRADKDCGNVILKVYKQIGVDLKDPAISSLLVDIRTQQQKKEKRLKDIVRSGNCIVKKFQKHHEDQLDHEQLVAQVGLRLISRVEDRPS
ncbi:hypothetical protein SESBI_12271 [Sesbania bispinosa]|nr:hypothetical protein SESBI_12271 [Sesbania bispinosa]